MRGRRSKLHHPTTTFRRYDPKDTHSVSHPLVGKLVAYIGRGESVGTVVRVDRSGRAIIQRHQGDYVRRVTTRLHEVSL